MKKNNYIVMVIAAIIGVLLLVLWYYLGFNKIDNPLDLTLSILWWIADALIVAGIIHFENARQEQIRTIYVSPAALFNSERGVVAVPDAADRVSAMENILQNLEYDFSNEDMPEADEFEYLYVVQTEKYKPAEEVEEAQDAQEAPASTPSADAAQATDSEDEKRPEWTGKVTKIDRENGNVETEFSSIEDLAALLAA